MYERSAIVLERYFDNLLNYRRECNLRDNYKNYCELVEKLEKYQINYQKELVAIQEYNESLEKIKEIQSAQKVLYKKNAELEYNRNLLFNNIDGKVEEIRKCIEKIEIEVEENNAKMKEVKENLLKALEEYNDKRFELSTCKREKKKAENEYNDIYEISRINFDGITEEDISEIKAFSKFDDIQSIIEILSENGKGEKIPFNQDVIENATRFGVETAKKEAASYAVIYDKMNKLLTDIDNGAARINLHKKYVRNERAKIDFILAVKEYEVQFLDYERMTIIHGENSHNQLMSEACANFNTDIIQINNLYELLLREISNKATKKAYKDLYNKSYLTNMEENEEKLKKEKSRVNLNIATLISSNYWRIEGLKNIYTIFYENVSKVFGRDIAEFDIPKEHNLDLNIEECNSRENDQEENEIVEKIPFKIHGNYDDIEEITSYSTNNDVQDESAFSMDYVEDVILSNSINNEGSNLNEEFDIFGEKYKEIDFSETNVIAAKSKIEGMSIGNEKNIFKKVEFEKDIPYEIETDEVQLFDELEKVQKNNGIKNFNLTKETAKRSNGVFSKFRKITNTKNNKFTDDIW